MTEAVRTRELLVQIEAKFIVVQEHIRELYQRPTCQRIKPNLLLRRRFWPTVLWRRLDDFRRPHLVCIVLWLVLRVELILRCARQLAKPVEDLSLHELGQCHLVIESTVLSLNSLEQLLLVLGLSQY